MVKHKRGSDVIHTDIIQKQACNIFGSIQRRSAPIGLVWQNNSCAYDSVITILYSIWTQNNVDWSRRFHTINVDWLGRLSDLFTRFNDGSLTLEAARDNLQHRYTEIDLIHMRFGGFMNISKVLDSLLLDEHPVRCSMVCCANVDCDLEFPQFDWSTSECLLEETTVVRSIKDWVSNDYRECENRYCPECRSVTVRKYSWIKLPSILAFCLSSNPGVTTEFDRTFSLKDDSDNEKVYTLRGVIYYSNAHFTVRLLQHDLYWDYDGARHGAIMLPIAGIDHPGHSAVAAIYSI